MERNLLYFSYYKFNNSNIIQFIIIIIRDEIKNKVNEISGLLIEIEKIIFE